jgi:hypothetical protein
MIFYSILFYSVSLSELPTHLSACLATYLSTEPVTYLLNLATRRPYTYSCFATRVCHPSYPPHLST